MMGTMGSGQKPAAPDTRARNDVLSAITSTRRQPAQSVAAPRQRSSAPARLHLPSLRQMALGAAVLLALVALLLWIWPYLGRTRTTQRPPDEGANQAAATTRPDDTADTQPPLTADS